MLAPTPSVLVVDDTPANIVAVEAVLAPLRARIVSAGSGEEALALIEQRDFALALLDLRLPGLSGSKTAALIQERPVDRRPPIIIMTAYSLSDEEVEHAYASGVVDILQKPYGATVLRTKAAVFLELYRQREQLLLQARQLHADFERLLIGIVSHDLKNPLNTISLGAEHLCRDGLNEQQRHVAERIRLAARRAIRLTHDLLDLSNVRHTGQLPLDARATDLHEIVGRAIEEVRDVYSTCTIDIERIGDTTAVLDAERISQAIVNLIGNAVRHAMDAHVLVRIEGGSSEVLVEVHNRGEPISERLMQSMFDPFKRGPNAETAERSVGLGLFIVDQVVRAHGGHVSVRSGRDMGTTFSLILPRGEPARSNGD